MDRIEHIKTRTANHTAYIPIVTKKRKRPVKVPAIHANMPDKHSTWPIGQFPGEQPGRV